MSALLKHEEQLEKALELGGFAHSLSDVMQQVATGQAQVFYNETAVLVTELVKTRIGHTVNLWLTAGEMEGVVELSRIATEAATEYGCNRATFMGRVGWRRAPAVLSDGWRERAVVFVKELGD